MSIFPAIPLTLLAFMAAPLTAAARVVEWRSAVATSGAGTSQFVAAEAVGNDVFLTGNGSSEFLFGSLKLLALPARPSGLVVGASRHPTTGALTASWQSRAESSRSVTFTDLAPLPGSDRLVVCGRFEKDIIFKDNLLDVSTLPLPLLGAVSLTPGSGIHGFVAVLDRSGTWKSAFLTPGVLPESIAADAANSLLVTGQGALAARYSTAGALIWKTAAPAGTSRLAHIAARGGRVAVLAEESAAAEGVVVRSLDAATGVIGWTRRAGGPGAESAGGLALDSQGTLHLSFSSDHRGTVIAGVSATAPDAAAGPALFTATLAADGALGRISPATGPGTGTLTCANLAVDASGAAWLACTAEGTWKFGDAAPATFSQAGMALQIDPAGKLQRAAPVRPTGGSGALRGIAIAAGSAVVTAGDYSGPSAPDLSPLPLLPRHTAAGGLLATLEAAAEQELWVARPSGLGGLTLPALRELLATLGTTVYAEVDMENGPQAVSFWGTAAVLAALVSDPRVIVEPESNQIPTGVNPDPGWGLARLGGAETATAPYHYPDSDRPVRLYLIDTAVANPAGWIDANAKLTLEKSVLIRGTGDPTQSSEFKHGTQMLSVVGGLPTGAGPGTPVRVVNFDIYPQGGTTTTTLLAKAVTEAVKHARAATDGLPAVICIATSSSTPSTSYTLKSSIELAVSDGIPVVVSAGNSGANAAAYIPAAYGSLEGVICTGSSDAADRPLASSNTGTAVDLLSPGQEIRTIGLSGALEPMTGTSPAAGLAAATALVEISLHGRRSPAEIEAALKAAAVTGGTPLLRMVEPAVAPRSLPDGPVTDPAKPVPLAAADGPDAGTPSPDSDGDGTADLVEAFHGGKPTGAGAPALAPAADGQLQFTFPVAAGEFDDSQPFVLKNGCRWTLQCSAALRTWEIPLGSLSKSTAADGRTWVTARFPAGGPACFVRLLIRGPADRD